MILRGKKIKYMSAQNWSSSTYTDVLDSDVQGVVRLLINPPCTQRTLTHCFLKTWNVQNAGPVQITMAWHGQAHHIQTTWPVQITMAWHGQAHHIQTTWHLRSTCRYNCYNFQIVHEALDTNVSLIHHTFNSLDSNNFELWFFFFFNLQRLWPYLCGTVCVASFARCNIILRTTRSVVHMVIFHVWSADHNEVFQFICPVLLNWCVPRSDRGSVVAETVSAVKYFMIWLA